MRGQQPGFTIIEEQNFMEQRLLTQAEFEALTGRSRWTQWRDREKGILGYYRLRFISKGNEHQKPKKNARFVKIKA